MSVLADRKGKKWTYRIYSLWKAQNTMITSEEAADTDLGMARLPVKVIKDRRHVLALRDRVLKADSSHYI
jgi:hypothetical protein